MTDSKDMRIEVRISRKLKDSVKAYADKRHISVSILINRLLYGIIEADEKCQNIEKS